MKYSWQWLKDYCPTGLAPEALADKLTDAGLEVEAVTRAGDDVVFDVEVVPVRADCLSMVGLAREISFIAGTPLSLPLVTLKEVGSSRGQPVEIAVEAADLCPRYSARVVTGLKVGPSPAALARRLETVGVRALNNVVDITNYVNLETGQPLHAFDLAKLRGRKIIVRRAAAGEKLVLLTGKEITFEGAELVIADAEGPVALAGIMGGAGSEVSASTETVVIESAYFDPVAIRKTARRYELATESSYRFERGTDPRATLEAADRAAALMGDVAGGVVLSGPFDLGKTSWPRAPITLRPARANLLLGTKLTGEAMADLLRRFNFEVDIDRRENLVVTAPAYRRDIVIEVDLVEEIGRAYGYERLAATLPSGRLPSPARVRREDCERLAREYFTAAGLYEVYTPSFTDGGQLTTYGLDATQAVPLANPVASHLSLLRPALWPGLAEVAMRNGRQGAPGVLVFELGTVFAAAEGGAFAERVHMAALAVGEVEPRRWGRQPPTADIFFVKGLAEGFARALGVPVTWNRAAFSVGDAGGVYLAFDVEPLGVAHVIEFDLGPLYRGAPPTARRYKAVSRFPSVVRDLALVMPEEVASGDIVSALGQSNKLAREVTVFDVFTGPALGAGKKSLGVRIRYQADDRTLTDDEVNAAREEGVKLVAAKFNAVLRAS